MWRFARHELRGAENRRRLTTGCRCCRTPASCQHQPISGNRKIIGRNCGEDALNIGSTYHCLGIEEVKTLGSCKWGGETLMDLRARRWLREWIIFHNCPVPRGHFVPHSSIGESERQGGGFHTGNHRDTRLPGMRAREAELLHAGAARHGRGCAAC